MICHVCKQEEIYYSPDSEGIIRFCCSVCGGNFWTIKEFADLLVFQHKVEKAYKEGKESFNSDLKDNYGGSHVRVQGASKVMTHLMFGLVAIAAKQIIRLII